MNARFSDYVTSGAFALALTRSQIAALSMVEGGEARYLASAAALERKGLVEQITAQLDGPIEATSVERRQWRLTAAGALVLNLLNQAGLTNAGAEALAREAEHLRAELDAANGKVADAFLRMRSLQARISKLEQDIEIRDATDEDRKFHLSLSLRDPLPGATVEQLVDPAADVGQPEWGA